MRSRHRPPPELSLMKGALVVVFCLVMLWLIGEIGLLISPPSAADKQCLRVSMAELGNCLKGMTK